MVHGRPWAAWTATASLAGGLSDHCFNRRGRIVIESKKRLGLSVHIVGPNRFGKFGCGCAASQGAVDPVAEQAVNDGKRVDIAAKCPCQMAEQPEPRLIFVASPSESFAMTTCAAGWACAIDLQEICFIAGIWLFLA
jgi:hypothetical protein